MTEWLSLKQAELKKHGEKVIDDYEKFASSTSKDVPDLLHVNPINDFIKGINLMHETAIDSFKVTMPNVDFVKLVNPFDYEKIIFNNPATIVLWKDGTKTVVKCQTKNGDVYDPEKGIALCFMKKALGNTSRALNDILNKEVR